MASSGRWVIAFLIFNNNIVILYYYNITIKNNWINHCKHNKMCYCNITIMHRGDFVARFKLDRNTISEKNNQELSVDFLKSANEELVKENKALIKENKELKKKIEELESRALINPRKVTYEQVKKIKELRASGLSYRAMVKEIGLSTCTIQRALKGIYD